FVPVMHCCIFSIIPPVFRKHENMMIYCSRNISDYYQCGKQFNVSAAAYLCGNHDMFSFSGLFDK
ncbi:hypothetical protein, partial [Flavonifractor plautii]|uniref:hypothetical protein n=1 Tax=Flavonifractor plautii TaxID=292800 RepID=UPI003D7F0644